MLLSRSVFAAPAPTYIHSNLCDIIAHPLAYSTRHVSTRGAVYTGVDRTNISNRDCPGTAITLVISDDVDKRVDVLSFHRKIRGWNMHGYATVLGTVVVTGDPIEPLVLMVDHVIDVSRNEPELETKAGEIDARSSAHHERQL